MKDYDNVDFKLDFEIARCQRWAGEQSREHHIERNHNTLAYVSVGDLNVLDFRRVSCVTLRTTARFHPNQLKLY